MCVLTKSLSFFSFQYALMDKPGKTALSYMLDSVSPFASFSDRLGWVERTKKSNLVFHFQFWGHPSSLFSSGFPVLLEKWAALIPWATGRKYRYWPFRAGLPSWCVNFSQLDLICKWRKASLLTHQGLDFLNYPV